MSNQNSLFNQIPEANLQQLADEMKMSVADLKSKAEAALSDPKVLENYTFEVGTSTTEGNCVTTPFEFGVKHILTVEGTSTVCPGPKWTARTVIKIVFFGQVVFETVIETSYRNSEICINPRVEHLFDVKLCVGARPRNGGTQPYISGKLCFATIFGWRCTEFFEWLG